MKLHQVHATGLALAGKCGIAYRYRYIEALKIPPAGRMISGSAAHRGHELDMQSKFYKRELLSEEEIKDHTATDFAERWEWAGEVEIQGNEGPDPKGFYLDRALRLAMVRHRELAPTIEPAEHDGEAAVEVPFSLALKGADLELVGRIDLITEPSGPQAAELDGMGVYEVRDAKNQAKSPNQSDGDDSLQLSAYAVAATSLRGQAPRRMFLDVAVDLKSGPKHKTIETLRDPGASAEMLALRLRRLSSIIESGNWAPADPAAWWCSREWCGYWDRCPFAQRPVSFGFSGLETGAKS